MVSLKKSKVAICSDLHLGVHVNSTDWHKIAINWATWYADELKRKKIKDIIFCGDWFHNRSEISVNTLDVAAQIFNIWKDFNIILMTGNHDLYYKHRTDVHSLSIFNGRTNITIVDNELTCSLFEKTVSFLPWGANIDKIPESDVIFGHLEIQTFKMNGNSICHTGYSADQLLRLAPLVISGHFHIRHKKIYGDRTILYVGNPFQMDYGDVNNDKGYYILDFDTLKYTFHHNNISPRYERINLSHLCRFKTLDGEITNIIQNNFVKLIIDLNIGHQDLDFISTKLNSLNPSQLHIDYDLNYNKFFDDDQINETDLSGIDITKAIEEFINMMEIDNKKDITDYTIELYKKCIQQ